MAFFCEMEPVKGVDRVEVAIDIEAGSLGVCNGWVMAVGVAVIDPDTMTVISKRRFVIPPSARHDRQYDNSALKIDPGILPVVAYLDPVIWGEFWCNHTGVLKQLVGEMATTTTAMAWNSIAHHLHAVIHAYAKVTLVGDCPDFDYGLLNHRLAIHVPNMHPNGVRYMGGKRMAIRDPSEQLRALPVLVQTGLKEAAVALSGGATHFPDDDAVYIGVLHALITEHVKRAHGQRAESA